MKYFLLVLILLLDGCGASRIVAPSGTSRLTEGYSVRLAGHELVFGATSEFTVTADRLIIRSTNRGTILERSKVQNITRFVDGIGTAIDPLKLQVESIRKFGPATPQCGTLRPLSHPRRKLDCSPTSDDIFTKIAEATGPGDLIPGIAHGGAGHCNDYTAIGTWWKNGNYDYTTGNGDPLATCVDLNAGGGTSQSGPFLHGLATDYQYSVSQEVVKLDSKVPLQGTDKSYTLTYRGPGVLIDGSTGYVPGDLKTSTFFYGPGIDGTGSTIKVNFYLGYPIIGKFLDYAGASVPRIVL